MKNRTIQLIAIFMLSIVASKAQNFTTYLKELKTSYRIEINAATYDVNGNAYIVGSFEDSLKFNPNSNIVQQSYVAIGDQDGFIGMIDTLGNWKWVVVINEGGDLGNCYDIALDTNNNIYVTGWANADATVLSNGLDNGTFVIENAPFLLKLVANGNSTPTFGWFKGGSGFEYQPSKLAIDKNNDILFACVHQTSPVNSNTFAGDLFTDFSNSSNAFVWKFNSGGAVIKRWQTSGENFALTYGLKTDKNNNVYLISSYTTNNNFSGSISIDSLTTVQNCNNRPCGPASPILVKFNSNLEYQWSRAEYYINAGYSPTYYLAIDTNNNALVYASLFDSVQIGNQYFYAATSSIYRQAVMYSYSAAGNLNFVKKYSTTGAGYAIAGGIACSNTNQLSISASFYDIENFNGFTNLGSGMMARINPLNGNINSMRFLQSGSPNFYGAIAARSGFVFLAGTNVGGDSLTNTMQWNNSLLHINTDIGFPDAGFAVQFADTLTLTNIAFTSTSELGSIKIYPNPTNSIINLIVPNQLTGNCRIEIFDIAGRIVKIVNHIVLDDYSSQKSIDVSELNNGVYTLKAVQKNNNYSAILSIIK